MNNDFFVRIILIMKGEDKDVVSFMQRKVMNENDNSINVELIPERQMTKDGKSFLVVFCNYESIKKYDKETLENKFAYIICRKRMSDIYKEIEELNLTGIMLYDVDGIYYYDLRKGVN